MNTDAVLLSCLGALFVILNKQIGRGLHLLSLGKGAEGHWDEAYRAPFIINGVLLLFLSFFAD